MCVIGGGPRGTSIVERLIANAGALVGDRPLRIHLVDPYPAGPGRVWRKQQADLLWLNTTAADNTILPDSSVTCEGPVDTGPTFLEWARSVAPGRLAGSELAGEVARVHPGWFPSRRLYSEYLTWTLERSAASAPPGVTLERRAARAVDLSEEGGRQLVWLDDGGEPLAVDAVVLATGHHDVAPAPEEADLAAFAEARGLAYLPRAYTADADLDRFEPGATVLVRGGGLAFIDCMVLLFEGRGGSYERGAEGRLVYRPSGAEPHLLVGSRRGVPYHSKPTYALGGPRPPLPHFFRAAGLAEMAERAGPLDYETHLRPLIAAELAYGYYHELWHAHPERVVGSWEVFVERLEEAASLASPLRWGTDALAAAVAAAVPHPADRLDLDRLERPLDGLAITDPGELQSTLLDYIAADLERRTDPAHSANLGLFLALLSCFGTLGVAAGQGLLSARSHALAADGAFYEFFSYVASGPPPPRLEQLAALARGGFVEFLGPDLTIKADIERGCFRADRAVGPPAVAHAMIEARLPAPSVSRDLDPLIARLFARGECTEDVRRDEDGFVYGTGRLRTDGELRVVGSDGSAHPARYALGPWTSAGRFSSGIARPGRNAAFFRQNDAVARAILSRIGTSGNPGENSVDPDEAEGVGDRLGLVR
ncbi:MAG: FAD/NAD(P)-binding protein [Acidimicrobiaceae bacterium]|nr:FAD/NAD(P)-binding protein [Acidimicrobiaceae bacterium]